MAVPADLSYDDGLARQTTNQLIPDNNQQLIDPADMREVIFKALDTWRDNYLAALQFMDESQTSALSSSNSAYNSLVQSLSLLAEFQSLVSSGYKPKGNWNIATNTPDLTAITKADGDAYIVKGPGTTSITGTSITAADGDAFIWDEAGSKWIYKANAHIPADGSVSPVKMAAPIANYFMELPADAAHIYVMLDAENGEILKVRRSDAGIEGYFIIEEINLQTNSVNTLSLKDSAVTYDKLNQNIKDLIYQVFDNSDSDFVTMVLDAESGIMSGLKKDGTHYFLKIELEDNSIKESWIEQAFRDRVPSAVDRKILDTNPYDLTTDEDLLWRSSEIEIPAKTSANTGFAFVQFPDIKTPILKGNNDTGTSLDFKETNGHAFRGTIFRGDFNVITSSGFGSAPQTYKGVYGNSFTNSYPAFPASPAAGDVYIIDCGNTTATKTANGKTFKNRDILLWDGSAWQIQSAPGDGTYISGEFEFWNIREAGWFGGIYYPVGSRIYIQGSDSRSGPKYVQYAKSKDGELFLMGECNGSFVTPASPISGDLYIFSADSTAAGVTGKATDFLVYYRGGWGLVDGKLVTVPAGQSYFLKSKKASDWAVRRTNKATAQVTVKAYGHKASIRRLTTGFVRLKSDSMFGVSQLGTKILTGINRQGVVESWGGATSENILTMLRDAIREGDPYAGAIHVIWHGQNNATDTAQIKNCAYKMAAICGSSQERFLFWSVLGARTMTWNGTRFVVSIHEGAKAKTNFVSELHDFYSAAFPMQWWSPYNALIETALLRTTKPSIQFPGMTDAQVAETYGILPLAYFFNFADKTFTQDNLVSLGNWSSAGLPTGGVDKNYYNRTAGGTVGSLIVNVAGVWTEYTPDYVHLSPEGADALSGKFVTYFNTIKW